MSTPNTLTDDVLREAGPAMDIVAASLRDLHANCASRAREYHRRSVEHRQRLDTKSLDRAEERRVEHLCAQEAVRANDMQGIAYCLEAILRHLTTDATRSAAREEET